MATVQIRKEDVGEVKDIQSLVTRLGEKYSGKWVAILENGEIIADEKVESLYDRANKKKIAALFQIPRKGELLLL